MVYLIGFLIQRGTYWLVNYERAADFTIIKNINNQKNCECMFGDLVLYNLFVYSQTNYLWQTICDNYRAD